MSGLRSSVSYFDRIFDKASSEKYLLSIRFHPDGLFFSVFDADSQKYIGFQSEILAGVTDIYKYLSTDGLLRNSFQKSVVIIPTSKYTIVPGSLYIPEMISEYFSFVHQLPVHDELRACDLITDDAKVVYSSNIAWFQLIEEFFPSATVLPGITAHANYCLPKFKGSRKSVMLLNLYDDNFDMVLLEEGKLKFCNNFNFKSAEDIIYYTIFVIDQLKVNAEKVEIKLSGNIQEKSNLIKLLRKYIRTVDVLDYHNNIQLSYALSEVEIFRYFDLFNPRLCEL